MNARTHGRRVLVTGLSLLLLAETALFAAAPAPADGAPQAAPAGAPAARGGGRGRGGQRMTPEQIAALPAPKYNPKRPLPAPGEDARDIESLLTAPPGMVMTRRNNFYERDAQGVTKPGTDLYRWASSGHFSNYDESQTGDWKKTIPDPLITESGLPVKDSETWWRVRRPELIALTEEWVYGKVPPVLPKIAWTATKTTNADGSVTTVASGNYINADGTPFLNPAGGGRRGGGAAPAPGIGGPAGRLDIPAANPFAAFLPSLPSFSAAAAPAVPAAGAPGAPAPGSRAGRGGRGGGGNLTVTYTVPANATGAVPLVQGGNAQRVFEMGFGTVSFVGQAPNVHTGLPSDWGTIRQNAWVVSMGLDYLETDKTVDAHQVAVTGHSIGGKQALQQGVMDQRIGLVFASCSGEGGASMSRHDWGETIDDTSQLAAGEYARNFQLWRGNWEKYPIDAHTLLALMAPRPVLVTGGIGDEWSDPIGVFWAAYYAAPVYRLLGNKDFSFTATEPPPPNTFVGEKLVAYRHIGAHYPTPEETAKYHEMIQKYFKVKPFAAASAR